jgi:predicted lipoprotein with Yx(FWY)xxD motif
MPRRAAVPTIVVLLVLAACRGVGAGSPSAQASASSTAVVGVAESADVGEHLVDAEGRTLYIFLNDSPGTSACSDDCAASWPPASVDEGQDPAGGDGVTGEISTLERDDGTLQLTIEGWPLYLYAADTAPGDTTGEGVGGVWFVARPDGSLPDGAGDASAEPSADGSMGDENPDDYY